MTTRLAPEDVRREAEVRIVEIDVQELAVHVARQCRGRLQRARGEERVGLPTALLPRETRVEREAALVGSRCRGEGDRKSVV